jgi:uncharacterized protein YneF (UPF0154 family)
VNPTKRLVLVVLATVVIFAAGVVTGSLVTRKSTRFQIAQPSWARFEAVRRAVDELDRRGELSSEQHLRIDQIIRDHQELIADYFSILEPDVQQVFRKMRENIREELTQEQRRQFEEVLRKRALRPMERRSEDFQRGPSQPGPRPGGIGNPGGPVPPPEGRRPRENY